MSLGTKVDMNEIRVKFDNSSLNVTWKFSFGYKRFSFKKSCFWLSSSSQHFLDGVAREGIEEESDK